MRAMMMPDDGGRIPYASLRVYNALRDLRALA